MDCAARELEEEIGLPCQQTNSNCFLFCFCWKFKRENVFVFGARFETKRRLEADERIREVVISLETIKEKLRNQEFEDLKTLIGLREALAYFESNGG